MTISGPIKNDKATPIIPAMAPTAVENVLWFGENQAAESTVGADIIMGPDNPINS